MVEIDTEMVQLRAAMVHLETSLKAYATAERFQTDAERLKSMCRQELKKIANLAESAGRKLAGEGI
ncbi:MAG: hypothetical protein Q7N50_07220 [Armatimonadota bacterium]|nr:hypothetical protein [Armatimonadota bacterium]